MSRHPTAIIHPQARLAPDVVVGPYAVIGAEVEIGAGTEVGAHAVLEGPLRMGARNRVFPHAVLGLIPQDVKFQGERSEVIIGDENSFREFCTVHRGTRGGGGVTRIGNRNLIMAYAHIAHDSILGDSIIFGNGATLAGHVVIEDHAIVGAFCGVHQFCRIGRHSFIGGYTVVTQDVLPFSRTVWERAAKTYGVNTLGLERRGFGQERIERLKSAFRLLTQAKLNTGQAVAQIRQTLDQNEDIEALVRFIESSERGVIK
ncbi:MAG: acyl-ACP--UDP-N-acetylglucosamine O-acyltransferase [Terriglobia bacterium]